jgi:hypothetical protein
MSDSLRASLDLLEGAGLVRLVAEAAGPPEAEYQFRHALTHEASYASLTKQRRRQLHTAIGRTIEELYPDRLQELSDLLAYHFAQAALPEPAFRYGLLASERALSTYAYDEASGHLDGALAIVGHQHPDLRARLLEARGDVHTLLRQGSSALDRFAAAIETWQASLKGPGMDILRLHRKIVHIALEMKWSIEKRDFERMTLAAEDSFRALDSAALELVDAPAHPETVRLRTTLSQAAWRMRTPPDWGAALRHALAAVNAAETLGSAEDLSSALGALSPVYFALGELRPSLDAALRRLELTRRPGFADLREHLDSLRGAGSARMYVGDYEGAIPLLRGAEQIAVRIQAVDQRFNVLSLLTQCWLRLDRWDEMLAREEEWEEIERRFPQERTGPVCFPLALRAVVHARRGDAARSRRLADRSMQIMVSTWGHSGWLRNAHY